MVAKRILIAGTKGASVLAEEVLNASATGAAVVILADPVLEKLKAEREVNRVFRHEHGFDLLEDVLADWKCQENIGKKIDFIIRERKYHKRQGKIFKRDSFDKMKEEGLLKTEFFVKSYPDIFNKKSNLTGGYREIISSCVIVAVADTLKYYELSEEGQPI